MELQLEKTSKGVSVPSLLAGIEVPGEENGKKFPLEQEGYLRTYCAGNFKYKFPLRKYSVNKLEDMGYVLVYWNYKED